MAQLPSGKRNQVVPRHDCRPSSLFRSMADNQRVLHRLQPEETTPNGIRPKRGATPWRKIFIKRGKCAPHEGITGYNKKSRGIAGVLPPTGTCWSCTPQRERCWGASLPTSTAQFFPTGRYFHLRPQVHHKKFSFTDQMWKAIAAFASISKRFSQRRPKMRDPQ